jgi:hypothetical protein
MLRHGPAPVGGRADSSNPVSSPAHGSTLSSISGGGAPVCSPLFPGRGLSKTVLMRGALKRTPVEVNDASVRCTTGVRHAGHLARRIAAALDPTTGRRGSSLVATNTSLDCANST